MKGLLVIVMMGVFMAVIMSGCGLMMTAMGEANSDLVLVELGGLVLGVLFIYFFLKSG